MHLNLFFNVPFLKKATTWLCSYLEITCCDVYVVFWMMRWDTSPVMLYPGIIRGFGLFYMIPPRSRRPDWGDPSPTCVPAAFAHDSALSIHSHLVAFTAASLAALIAFRISSFWAAAEYMF